MFSCKFFDHTLRRTFAFHEKKKMSSEKKTPHEWINLKIHLKTSIFFYDGHINTAAPSSFEYTSKKENRIHCLSTTFSLSRHSHRKMMRKKEEEKWRNEKEKWKGELHLQFRNVMRITTLKNIPIPIALSGDFHPFLLSYFLFLWQQKTRIVIFIVLAHFFMWYCFISLHLSLFNKRFIFSWGFFSLGIVNYSDIITSLVACKKVLVITNVPLLL